MKTYLPNILITGGHGQLGTVLSQHLIAKQFPVIIASRDILDITDCNAIQHAITTYSPDIIINSAAYTAVDKAENEIEQVLRINHLGAQHIARACAKNQIPLLHISTDYIFDGTKSLPYIEADAANPINVYGKSKWLGEEAVREECEQHIILRVSAVFSEYGHNFLKSILRLATERNELNIVADQFTCPTYAGHIADAITQIIPQLSSWGTYHYCDATPVSWHQFATAIINAAKSYQPLRVKSINSITTAEYPTLAKRPAYSVLACEKINNHFGVNQAEWMSAIQMIVKRIMNI